MACHRFRTADRGAKNSVGGGTARAWRPGMNSTMFSVKRTFLRTVHFGRKLLEPFGLTPARFDLLYVVWKRPYGRQSELRRILGLHPSTVSKMLTKLDDEFVYRGWENENKREVLVRLTPQGTQVFEAAMAELVRSGAIDGFMEWAVAGPCRRESKRGVAVLNLEEGLLRVRRTFFDCARLLYVFDPEEWGADATRELPDWPRERARLSMRRWRAMARA